MPWNHNQRPFYIREKGKGRNSSLGSSHFILNNYLETASLDLISAVVLLTLLCSIRKSFFTDVGGTVRLFGLMEITSELWRKGFSGSAKDIVSVNGLRVESPWNNSCPSVINDHILKLILARLMKRLLIKSRSNRVVRVIIIYFLGKCLWGFWFYMLVCAAKHT